MQIGATVTLALMLFAAPATAAPANWSFDWSQLSYYQDGTAVVPMSPFGRCNVNYMPDNTLSFLNVVGNVGGHPNRWLVQNFPVLPSSLIGTGTFYSQCFVDFGTPTGTAVGLVDVTYYGMSSMPFMTAPTPFANVMETVPLDTDTIDTGVPSGVGALGTPPNVNWNVPYTTPTVAYHPNVPNVTQRKNYCGPGSATNSMAWLMTANGYPNSATNGQIQDELAGYMANSLTGNWDDKEMTGKLTFIKNHSLPVEVHYTGGVKAPTAGNYTDPNGQGTARNDGAITCDWLIREMQKGQDIELMTNTHWVVLEGMVSWNGICQILYRDDPYQHGNSTTGAEQAVINARHVWTVYDGTNINLGNGVEKLQAAVAESPAPYTAGDAVRAARIAAGLLTATPLDKSRYDLDKNGKIELKDAANIARKIAGFGTNP